MIFLTANMWDYATLIARLVPNRLHSRIVARVEGRQEEDVFPVCNRTNTRGAAARLAAGAGMNLVSRVHALRFLRGWIVVTLTRRGA